MAAAYELQLDASKVQLATLRQTRLPGLLRNRCGVLHGQDAWVAETAFRDARAVRHRRIDLLVNACSEPRAARADAPNNFV